MFIRAMFMMRKETVPIVMNAILNLSDVTGMKLLNGILKMGNVRAA